ncbi:MAG TPA: hypothetical protein VIN08_03685 [Ohtaekwangia sp.]|uniref:hypothetical protein n=1 Tax=Ohtaekwangia sp. TaxID=2066019 RepID=UPI002F95B214
MELLTPNPIAWVILTIATMVLLGSIILYFVFFFRAVGSPGIERFHRFTFITMAIGAIFTVLNVFTYPFLSLDLTLPLPVRSDHFGSIAAFLPFIAFLVASVLLYRKKSHPDIKLLQIIWSLLALFNIVDAALYLYSYSVWAEPTPAILNLDSESGGGVIIQHLQDRKRILLKVIYPAVWAIMCVVGVNKLFSRT